ncbi:MAG: hypothetical protein AAB551_01075 [Patescibacteria group bacterium]
MTREPIEVLHVEDSPDDEDIIRDVVIRSLPSARFHPFEGADDALSYVRECKQPFDFAILDGQPLREASLADLTQHLSAFGTRVIVCTGGVPSSEAARLHQLWSKRGIVGIVDKNQLGPLAHISGLLHPEGHEAHDAAQKAISASTREFLSRFGL